MKLLTFLFFSLFPIFCFSALDTTSVGISLAEAKTSALAIGLLVLGVVSGISVIGLGVHMVRKV